MQDIEQNYARCFSSAAGAAVLAHLRSITIERWLGADSSDNVLRSLEAQRALVHQIESLIKRGKL
jgi:hypothetical protein